jgi:protease-4
MPNSLVGSIGVIHLRPILEQLLGKVGVEFSVFKGGRLKDMGGFWRGPTDEESEKYQELITEIYDNFVFVVVQGRKLEEAHVRELATGEIFTARKGKELGLVDEMMDFEQSLELAARLGNTQPRPRWFRPKRSMSERLTGRSASQQLGLGLLGPEVRQFLAGGIYYMDPGFLLGPYHSAD